MNESTAPEIKEEIPETPNIVDDVPAEDPRDAQIKQLEQDMDLLRQENHQLRCARDQARDYAKGIAHQLKKERADRTQPIKWPSILFGLFFVLAVFVALCVAKCWMVSLLGEILFCGCTAGCAFFGGILWSRTRK